MISDDQIMKTQTCFLQEMAQKERIQPEMGGLGAETLGTETFVVSVPPRLKMSGLVKVSVSRDFILKSRSRSRFHETQNESLGLGLGFMRPKLKVSVSVSFLRPGKLLVSPITAF